MTGRFLGWLSVKKNDYLISLVCGLVLYKALILIFIVLAPHAFPGFFDVADYFRVFRWPVDRMPSDITYFTTFDSQHYLYISQYGYKPHIMPNGFMPLWPVLIRFFQWMTFNDHIASALVLSNVFSTAGFVLFYQFVRRQKGRDAALASLLFLLCFPTAYYFSLPYSESLFFFLIVIFLSYLVKNKYSVVFVTAVLLTLTRVVGLLLVVPILWRLVTSKEKGIAWLALLGPPIGLLISMNIYQCYTGDPFVYFSTQKTFFSAAPSIEHCFKIVDFLKFYFSRPARIFGYPTGVFERIFFAWYVVSLMLLWRKNKLWFMFTLPMGMVPALSQTLAAFARYLVVVLPLFIVSGRTLSSPKKKPWFCAALVIMFFLQIIYLIRHITNRWVA